MTCAYFRCFQLSGQHTSHNSEIVISHISASCLAFGTLIIYYHCVVVLFPNHLDVSASFNQERRRWPGRRTVCDQFVCYNLYWILVHFSELHAYTCFGLYMPFFLLEKSTATLSQCPSVLVIKQVIALVRLNYLSDVNIFVSGFATSADYDKTVFAYIQPFYLC